MSTRLPSRVAADAAPPMSFSLAMNSLPTGREAFMKATSDWTKVVRAAEGLIASQRLVGSTIATFLNTNVRDRRFRSAWPSYETLAQAAGFTTRTVVTAIKNLRSCGLLAVLPECKGKCPGGRTNLFTIRLDRLDHFREAVAARSQRNWLKKFSSVDFSDEIIGSGEKQAESGEIYHQKAGNPDLNDMKDCLTDLTDISFIKRTSKLAQMGLAPLSPQLQVSAKKSGTNCHHDLAVCLGEGDVEKGYWFAELLGDQTFDHFAYRLFANPTQAEEIRREIAMVVKQNKKT